MGFITYLKFYNKHLSIFDFLMNFKEPKDSIV
jgi:hypothetical protein